MKLYIKFLLCMVMVGNLLADPVFEINPKQPQQIVTNTRDFTIALPSNRTTGYQWKIASLSEGMSVVNQRYIAPKESCCGAPGIEKIKVHLSKKFSGSGEIRLYLIRPWEGSKNAQALSISVKSQ